MKQKNAISNRGDFIMSGKDCFADMENDKMLDLTKKKLVDRISIGIERILTKEEVEKHLSEITQQYDNSKKVEICDYVVFRNQGRTWKGFVCIISKGSFDIIGDDWNTLIPCLYESKMEKFEIISVIPAEIAIACLAKAFECADRIE